MLPFSRRFREALLKSTRTWLMHFTNYSNWQIFVTTPGNIVEAFSKDCAFGGGFDNHPIFKIAILTSSPSRGTRPHKCRP